MNSLEHHENVFGSMVHTEIQFCEKKVALMLLKVETECLIEGGKKTSC